MKSSDEIMNMKTMFDTGASSVTASRMDPRFCYCSYVPESYSAVKRYPVVVIVHGSERGMETYRDKFSAFAEEHEVVVISPLFPVNALGPNDMHSYKFVRYGGVNFDDILFDMIEEVGEIYSLDSEKLLMYGFSGGGQFTHRFAYAHPHRLRAASIGAPGAITLIDDTRDFWVGTRNFEKIFGHPVDLDELRKVQIQMLVGDEDVLPRWVEIRKTDKVYWMDGANDAGITRVERMEALRDNFEANDIPVDYRTFEGVAHRDEEMLPTVMTFFADALKRK